MSQEQIFLYCDKFRKVWRKLICCLVFMLEILEFNVNLVSFLAPNKEQELYIYVL